MLQPTKPRPPSADGIGLVRARMRDIGKFVMWTWREMVRSRNGWATILIVAAGGYLLAFGLPSGVFDIPWAKVVKESKGQFLGWPWHILGAMFWLVLVRGIASICMSLALAVVGHSVTWLWFVASPRSGIYTSGDRRAVIVITATSLNGQSTWVLSKHVVARRSRGYGAHLRWAMGGKLTALAAEMGATIQTRAASRFARGIFIRQFPALEIVRKGLRYESALLDPDDSLGREALPEMVAQAVRGAAFGPSSGSISALVGSWGSGKSWVLHRALPLLEFPEVSSDSIRIVQFNPWLFSDEESLFAGFSELVLREIRDKRTRKRIARGFRLIGPASKYGPVDLSGTTKALGDVIDPPSSPSTIAQAFASGLNRSRRKLCIVMDDIDRLNPDELVTLFKLIRLLGNVPNVSYLLSYDEDTVLYLLQSTDIARQNPERARSFLEKIVEHKHRIPPLTHEQTYALAFDPLIAYGKNNGLDVHRRSMESLDWIFRQSLARRLTTARAIERFLSEVTLLPETLRQEVDFKDWCLAAFLKAQMPAVWKFVVEHRSEFLDKRFRGPWQADGDKEAFGESIPSRLTDLGVDSETLGIAIDVLNSMFPAISVPGGSTLIGGSTVQESEKRRGIGHEDYFDRYTWTGLPPSDFSDQVIVQLLRNLPPLPRPAVASSELAELLVSRQRTILDRILRNLDDPAISKASLVYFLGYCLPLDDEQDDSRRDRSQVILSAGHIVSQLNEADAAAVFGWAETHCVEAEELFYELLIRPNYFAESPFISDHLSEQRSQAILRLEAELAAGGAPTVDEPERRRLAFKLIALDELRFGGFVWRQVDSSNWRPDDVVALFINCFPSETGGRESLEQNGVRESIARRVLGDDFFLSVYPVNNVTDAHERCLAVDGNDGGRPSDLGTMRRTAAEAVAVVSERIGLKRQLENVGGPT